MSNEWSRILVVGSGGSGKSTLSRVVGARLGLPVVHLDRLYWLPNWVEPSADDWLDQVTELAAADRWVMDGNYSRTLGPRLARSDAIVLLDVSRWLAIARVVRRRILFHGRRRPDMAPGCPEKIDLVFLRWIWNYRKNSLPRLLAAIDAADARPRLIRLHGQRRLDAWLRSI